MNENLPYYLTFSYVLGIGPITFNLLIKHYSSVKKAYNASFSSLSEVIGKRLAEKFTTFRNNFNVTEELDMIKKNNITVLIREDKHFPTALLNLSDSPICLYIKGDLTIYNFDEDFYFGVVGTRKPTSYGEQIARKFSYELALEGMVIVSGMAMGIDAIAHNAALDAGKKTIAFLGCGVNIVYPPVNYKLYDRILENNGLIISEVPPNMAVLPGLFIQRNRLISGISKGILVAEGLKDSGSLITARFAAQQGKEVFAPPSPITSEQSEAPNMLIKEGAKMVTNINDILEEFKMSKTLLNSNDIVEKLSQEEQSIYKLLMTEPFDSDEIARSLNLPVYKILTILSNLELQGIVEQRGSKYRIKIT